MLEAFVYKVRLTVKSLKKEFKVDLFPNSDLRARPQVGQSDRVHDVSARAHLLHLDAALLLPQGAREVRDVPLRLLLHVPDPHAGGLAGGHVQDHGTGMSIFNE